MIAASPADVPPLASTPISANCEPPENINRLSTQVCQTSSPDATASAPNDTPYVATASPTAKLERIAAARALPSGVVLPAKRYCPASFTEWMPLL